VKYQKPEHYLSVFFGTFPNLCITNVEGYVLVCEYNNGYEVSCDDYKSIHQQEYGIV